MKVLVIGSLNLDLVVSLDRFPSEGETLFGNNIKQLVGGKGANQASSAALQNVSTTMWGLVGSDEFANFIVANINKLNINNKISYSDKSTGMALIETDKNGKNRIVVIAGANSDFSVAKAKENIDLLDSHDIIIMQFEIPLATVEFIAEEAKKRGKIIIVNPAPALSCSDNLLKNTTYLVPNEHELSIITNLPTSNQNEIETACKLLYSKGLENILVTLGENGVFCFNADSKKLINGVKVKALDTTGAGDAFIGGFAGALAKKMNLDEAILHANKVAAISVTRIGAFASAGSFDEATKI